MPYWLQQQGTLADDLAGITDPWGNYSRIIFVFAFCCAAHPNVCHEPVEHDSYCVALYQGCLASRGRLEYHRSVAATCVLRGRVCVLCVFGRKCIAGWYYFS
jgi:hypothetical protein